VGGKLEKKRGRKKRVRNERGKKYDVFRRENMKKA